MKKNLLFAVLLLFGLLARGQTISEITNILNTKPQTVTTADADATDEDLIAAIDLTSLGYRAVNIQIKGTWTGTVTFQGSNDNFTTVDNVLSYSPTAGTWATSTTANGTFIIPSLYGKIRVRLTSAGSGTVSSVAYGFLNNVYFPTSLVTVSGTIAATQSGTWNINNISGTVSLPTGAATAANQTTGNTSLATIAGAVAGTEMQVDILSIAAGDNNIGNVDIVTMPNITISTFPDNEPFNIAQIGGNTVLTGNGVTGNGSIRVTVASDNTAFTVNAAQSGTWNIGSITTLPALVAGTANIGDVDIDKWGGTSLGTPTNFGTTPGAVIASSANASIFLGTVAASSGNGASGTGVLRVAQVNDGTGVLATVTTVSTVTNLSQLGGNAIAMNTGTRSAGTQRVTIATDDIVPASQSGTWTMQPGNTANTTPWLFSNTPATSGGLTTYHLVSAASTNATSVKASAGQLYGYYIFNANAAARKVAFHNTAGTPTAGSSVFFSIVIPASSGANVEFANGVAFSTGIGITTVTGTADSDNTAVASGDLIINLFYK